MKSLLKEAIHIRREKGVSALLARTFAFLYRKTVRRKLPVTGTYSKAGVNTDYKYLFDPYIPGLSTQDEPNHEWALVSALETNVREGDTVTVIAAGSGATCVIAARLAGPDGHVVGYEGSHKRVAEAERTFSLNDAGSRCDVKHAIIGDVFYLEEQNPHSIEPEQISPDELPRCDVLELDCEGAEKRILKEMTIRPRTIIVETHPHFESPADEIQEILIETGYEISDVRDRKGLPVITAQAKGS